ncbi:hypothetical protein O3M35_008726 [Rhynocoris fuscipes]|uniref:Uncharacterized protein n=1 Tax=Rhynocoris fuscipes TaxID=488301 RepID=A0AAW1D9N4_9HEMI
MCDEDRRRVKRRGNRDSSTSSSSGSEDSIRPAQTAGKHSKEKHDKKKLSWHEFLSKITVGVSTVYERLKKPIYRVFNLNILRLMARKSASVEDTTVASPTDTSETLVGKSYQTWSIRSTVEGKADKDEGTESLVSENTDDIPYIRLYTWAIARSLPDSRRFVMTSIRELIIFILFMFFIILVAMDSLHLYKNIYCQTVMNVLTKTLYTTNSSITAVTNTTGTYYSIRTVPDVWNYINHHLLNVLYFYHKDDRRTVVLLDSDPLMTLFDNILLGPPRIRQVRVKANSCKVPKLFTKWYKRCYDYYSERKEDRHPHKPKYQLTNDIKQAWSWRRTEGSTHFTGKVSRYSPNGYYVDLSRRYNDTNHTIYELKRNHWIDRATRALFFEFVAYTPNTNLFAVVKLVMEMPPGGGVLPMSSCYSMELITVYDVWGILLVICKGILCLFIAYYIIQLLADCKYFSLFYVCSFWGFLDLAIIILFCLMAIMAITREVILMSKLPKLVDNIDKNKHGSFDGILLFVQIINATFACFIILCGIKFIKYFTMSTTVAIIFNTIGKAAVRLLCISLIALFLLLGLSVAGHLVFGSYIEEFSTIPGSIFALFTLPVGGFHFFEETLHHSVGLAPLYLVIYIFIFAIVILSLFIAVLVYTYERAEEKRILFGPKQKYGLSKYLLSVGAWITSWCGCLATSERLKKKSKIMDAKMEYEEIISILARHGFRGDEIKYFLKKHNIEKHRENSEQQLISMYKDLKTKQLLMKEVELHDNLLNHTTGLQNKLEAVESNLQYMSTHVTNLMRKLRMRETRSSL